MSRFLITFGADVQCDRAALADEAGSAEDADERTIWARASASPVAELPSPRPRRGLGRRSPEEAQSRAS